MTGSSAEYSNSDLPCREDEPCWPVTPYGLSKLGETIYARQLIERYPLSIRVARVFIPYGPLDAPQKLIPNVVQALKRREAVDLSPCHQARDFIYIDDLVQGYRRLIEDLQRPTLFDVVNLCSGQAIPLRELLSELADLLGRDKSLLRFGARSMRPGEPPISYGANQKAKDMLGWQPRSLREGLQCYLKALDMAP